MTTVPPTPPAAPSGAPAAKSPILSILSLVGGVLGLLLACCWGAGIAFAIAGIVLGTLGRKREPNGKGLALAGLITGWVAVALCIIMWVLLILAIVLPGVINIPYLPSTGSFGY